ncbi:MAG: ribbon-helix-helix protein, CopG family [Actinomycetota bacterium]
MARKQVLVQLNDELLKRLDELGQQTGQSRSAMVRDAVEWYLARESKAEKDRRSIEGYTRIPDTVDEDLAALAEWSLRESLEEESW